MDEIRYNDDWAAIDAARDLPEAWVFEDAKNETFVVVGNPADADRLSKVGDWWLVWSSVGGLADA